MNWIVRFALMRPRLKFFWGAIATWLVSVALFASRHIGWMVFTLVLCFVCLFLSWLFESI